MNIRGTISEYELIAISRKKPWITVRDNKNEMAKGKSQYQFKERTDIGVRMHWNIATSFFPGVRQKSHSCR